MLSVVGTQTIFTYAWSYIQTLIFLVNIIKEMRDHQIWFEIEERLFEIKDSLFDIQGLKLFFHIKERLFEIEEWLFQIKERSFGTEESFKKMFLNSLRKKEWPLRKFSSWELKLAQNVH